MTVDWIQLWNSPRRPWGDPPLPPRIKKPADTPLSNHNSNLILNEVVVLCDLVTSLRSFFLKNKIKNIFTSNFLLFYYIYNNYFSWHFTCILNVSPSKVTLVLLRDNKNTDIFKYKVWPYIFIFLSWFN
jgi:hypothetical protein